MNSRITILHARPWSMVDEDTKARREGVSLQYVMTDRLAPAADAETGELGYTVTKESVSVEAAKALVEVPGVYDAEFVLRGRAGKNVLAVSAVTFIGKK